MVGKFWEDKCEYEKYTYFGWDPLIRYTDDYYKQYIFDSRPINTWGGGGLQGFIYDWVVTWVTLIFEVSKYKNFIY